MGRRQEPPRGANVAQEYFFAKVIVMTDNFKHRLGEGSFGIVYYGKLPDGQEVAVKRASRNSQQGAKEFYNEVNYYLTPINICCSQTIIMFHNNWFDFHKLVICMFISLSHSLMLIVDLNILNPRFQLIHSKLEVDQSEKNLKKFCHKWPQVQNFTTKWKNAPIWKNWPKEKRSWNSDHSFLHVTKI